MEASSSMRGPLTYEDIELELPLPEGGYRTVVIPHRLLIQKAMEQLPDIVVADFQQLSPQEQTIKLGLKAAVRTVLGFLEYVFAKQDKDFRYPRPMPPEEMVRRNLDILVYATQYVCKIGLLAASDQWTVRLEGHYGDDWVFIVDGFAPASSEVGQALDVGQERGSADSAEDPRAAIAPPLPSPQQ